MLVPEKAARLIGVTPREIYRRIEQGSLHFVESENGSLLICCADQLETTKSFSSEDE